MQTLAWFHHAWLEPEESVKKEPLEEEALGAPLEDEKEPLNTREAELSLGAGARPRDFLQSLHFSPQKERTHESTIRLPKGNEQMKK